MSTSRILVSVSALVLLVGNVAAAEPDRPNILVFLVDDMGWQDTSVPFHSEETPFNRRYRTPNMQRLAAGGMKFTQAYACTVCTPTRVSLITGLAAPRHRVTNWILRVDPGTDRPHPTLEFPRWNTGGLSPVSGVERTVHATPLAEVLRGSRLSHDSRRQGPFRRDRHAGGQSDEPRLRRQYRRARRRRTGQLPGNRQLQRQASQG